MSKTTIIWLIGSNATGKTTQAAMVHKQLMPVLTPELHIGKENGVEWSYTQLSQLSSNLGKFYHPIIMDEGEKGIECCGTDTLSKKAQIMKSFEKACETSPLVIVEGVMATGTWIDFIKTPDTSVLLVLLDINLETNLQRLAERRARKKGIKPEDVEFTEKTTKNINGKIKGFRSLYDRIKDKVDFSAKFDTTEMGIDAISKQIIGLIGFVI